MKVCLFNFLPIKIFFGPVSAILALRTMNIQTLMPSLLWICLVYPMLILNTILTTIFFPLGNMIRMVISRTSFILSCRSWEIGNIPTCDAGRMHYCIVSCLHQTYSFDPFICLEEIFCTSVWALSVNSDSSPHFGGVHSFYSSKGRYI